MDNQPDAQGQPRRPRLVLPGAGEGPSRPKIVLPGQGLIDPSAPPQAEATPAIAEIQESESIGPETVVLIQEEPVLEPNAIFLNEEPGEIPAPADDFLTEPPSDFLADPSPPEVQAAPAELKNIAPRRLGPPVAWVPPEFADEPDLPGQSFPQASPAEPYQVPAWQPDMAEYQPEAEAGEAVEPSEAGAFAGYDPNNETEYAVDNAWPEPEYHQDHATEDYPAEESIPMAEPVPLAHVPSPRVARSLTSPHQVRPGTHQVSLRATDRYHSTPSHSPLPQSATVAQPHVAPPTPHKPVIPAAERLLPAWLLVIIGLLLGTIGSIYTVARTPMGEKFGLISRTESAAYATDLLKEERSQVQAMLDEYHENAKINLAEEMAEFRSEMGRKLPEKMSPAELRQPAKSAPAGDDKTEKPADAEKPAGEDKAEEPKPEDPAK